MLCKNWHACWTSPDSDSSPEHILSFSLFIQGEASLQMRLHPAKKQFSAEFIVRRRKAGDVLQYYWLSTLSIRFASLSYRFFFFFYLPFRFVWMKFPKRYVVFDSIFCFIKILCLCIWARRVKIRVFHDFFFAMVAKSVWRLMVCLHAVQSQDGRCHELGLRHRSSISCARRVSVE